MKQTTLPEDFSQLRAYGGRISDHVETVMRGDLDRALTDCDPLLAEVLHYALFNGGKRIRPLLTILSSTLCGREDTTLYLLASAFEYLHVATLIHDDVIDHAGQRRGHATVASRFGMPAAILAGDWLHARSMHHIGQLAGPEGLRLFCRATGSMVDGEFLQLRHVANLQAGEEAYFAVIKRKTGNLIASTCEIGALYAGTTPERQQALADYGERIGIAFQVVDDLLDYLGSESNTGKQVGNDFVEGKITLPLLRGFAQATPEDRQVFADLLEGDRSLPAAYARLHQLIAKYDGFSSAAQTARELTDQAQQALTPFIDSDTPEGIVLLKGLARYILSRNK